MFNESWQWMKLGALKCFLFYGGWEFIVLCFIVTNLGAKLTKLPAVRHNAYTKNKVRPLATE